METYQRVLEWKEVDQIIQRLVQLRETEGSKLMQYADPHYVAWNLVQCSRNRQVVICYEGDKLLGIVVFDVINDWWTALPILVEKMILCVAPDYKGFARDAISILDEKAEEYKAAMIVAGCMFQKNPQIVTNSYKKNGYKIQYPCYVKVLMEDKNDDS